MHVYKRPGLHGAGLRKAVEAEQSAKTRRQKLSKDRAGARGACCSNMLHKTGTLPMRVLFLGHYVQRVLRLQRSSGLCSSRRSGQWMQRILSALQISAHAWIR